MLIRVVCPACYTNLQVPRTHAGRVVRCFSCGQRVKVPHSSGMALVPLVLGLAGATVLLFGVFTPIFSVPVLGSLNYFHNGKGDGVVILVLAAISVLLTLGRCYKTLWVTGLASVALLAFTFTNFQVRIARLEANVFDRSEDNPFGSIAALAVRRWRSRR